MQHTPPPAPRKTMAGTSSVLTRSAYRRMEQASIVEPEKTASEPNALKEERSEMRSASRKGSSKSSYEVRKRHLELEAAEQKAKIDKELIEKRLAAEIAVLEKEESVRSRSRSRASTNVSIQAEEKVEQWFEHSQLDVEHQPTADFHHLARALENLATTTATTNVQLLSRLATPKDLPPFFGDSLEWLQFKKNYEESTALCKYSDVENISRLAKCIRGEAREIISSLLISCTSPKEIIDALELRYGRPEIIICKITSQIRKIPPLSQTYHNDIVNFAIKLKNFVAAIQAIKEEDYLRSPDLFRNVLSKCPSVLITKWADYSYEKKSTKSKLESFTEFLLLEANKVASAGISHIHCQIENKRKPDERHHHTVLLKSEHRNFEKCLFCRSENKHTLVNCTKFKRALRRDRWRFVKINKLCHKCLIAKHDKEHCPSPSCDMEGCGLPHHRLLHWLPKVSTQTGPTSSATSESATNDIATSESATRSSENNNLISSETVANTMSVSKSSVMLKVVRVNLHGPNGVISTYALLDDGATVSLISADIADRVNLTGQSELLHIRGAWDSGEISCRSEIVNFKISNSDNKIFELSARKIRELDLPVQKLTKINISRYEHLQNLKDYLYCESVKPQLLIGQDNYHLLVPKKTIIRNKNEPCATLTPLGWCIHGVIPYAARRPLLPEHTLITIPVCCRSPKAAPRARPASAATALLTTRALTHTSAGAASGTQCIARTQHYLPLATITADAPRLECYAEKITDKELHEIVRNSFTFEAIGVSTKMRENKNDLKAIDILENTCKLNENKWEVGLPWKNNAKLNDSYLNAKKRFLNIEKKMISDPAFASRYKERVTYLFENDYARPIQFEENAQRIWYLPHFAVDNPNKKKLRLVFDAAATSQGLSLNDYLLCGPDLLQSLLGIMLRFREGRIAITGDIKDMFLRVKIIENDQHALRFLWRDDPSKPIQIFMMTSLIFGANCSPFVAQFIKNKNAKRFSTLMPKATEAIIHNHFMDDYIDSFDDENTAIQVMQQVSQIHQKGNFEIRNWTSNNPIVCSSTPKETLSQAAIEFKIEENNLSERTLGLLWYPSSDTLAFDLSLRRIPGKVLQGIKKPTKRELLCITMSIFDIYGLLAPFVIRMKIILQNTWKMNLKWDDEILDKHFTVFHEWLTDLRSIKNLRIPRYYFGCGVTSENNQTNSNLQLHIFCDASPAAYAAVAYWRSESERDGVRVTFILCKSRVAPIKPVSIPRLELQGAVIACRLADTIQREHRIKPSKRYFWTDSSIVMHWITNETRNYKVFIANRLGEIDDLSSINEWNHVTSNLNIADQATKLNNYKLQDDCEWFRGPEFLYKRTSEWPSASAPEKEKINKKDLEIIHTITTIENKNKLPVPEPTRFSSWLRLLRTTATILVFIDKCKKKSSCNSILTTEYLEKAEKIIIRQMQRESFWTEYSNLKLNKPLDKTSRLNKLSPVLDSEDIIRVGGRIGAAPEIDEKIKHPVILDGRHPVARLIIKYYHIKAIHANNEFVVNELRQSYWILNLRPTVRTIASQCLSCRIRKTTPSYPRMGNLPESRLSHHQRPFTHCGVDLFGPVSVAVGRRREKRYGVLFTCMTVRAVHIEIVSSLSTDSFIMALRRMAARRGWPSHMYSDNGTNFRGADTELKKSFRELDQTTVSTEMANRGVTWHFVSPASPHMGGAWERLIRSIKTALRVILMERAPREETLLTLLAEVENMVNSRPLTHVSVEHHSDAALTPNHFLLGSSSNSPVPGQFNDGDLYLRKQWRIAQRLSDLFWNRWIKEYLPTLIPRQKWFSEGRKLKEGDIVFVVDPASPRNMWPRGIISKVYPGCDGRVRVVDIRTKTGTLRRPACKVALLPVNDECH